MVAVARELPNTGYALEVDGRLKTQFETKEGAWTGAEELKKRFPMLRVKIYDAETKTTEEFQLRVAKGSEAAFEQVWMSRDSHLEKVPGFVEFHLLKGPEAEDHTLYASHTIWENRATFEAWTRSEAFRAAHNRAGDNKPLYLDHPQFEGFEVRQTVGRGRTA